MPVAWITSTGPVARSTAGRRSRCHDSYRASRGSGRGRTGIGGVHGGGRRAAVAGADARPGRGRRGPARAADRLEGGARRAAGHPVPALLEGDGHPQTVDPWVQESPTTAGPDRAAPPPLGRMAAMSGEPDLEFWRTRRVLVTGGSGFLGQAVLDRLSARQRRLGGGADERRLRPARPRGRRPPCSPSVEPDLVIHLAARVGGIGANMARPADLYLDNLLMGTYVLDEARRARHRQDGHGRHDLLVPQVHAGAVPARTRSGRATPRRPTRPTASPSWPSSCSSRPTGRSTARAPST